MAARRRTPPARGGRAGGARKDVHERALGLLAVRPRSRQELERRLLGAGFDADEVCGELERLERVALIDDESFAVAMVESRLGRRGESRRAVAGRLAQAGVDREVAARALDAAVEGDQARADRLAASKARTLVGLEPRVAFQRLFGFLARRGYGAEVARAAARRALALEGVEA
jgi:regulatory protein